MFGSRQVDISITSERAGAKNKKVPAICNSGVIYSIARSPSAHTFTSWYINFMFGVSDSMHYRRNVNKRVQLKHMCHARPHNLSHMSYFCRSFEQSELSRTYLGALSMHKVLLIIE